MPGNSDPNCENTMRIFKNRFCKCNHSSMSISSHINLLNARIPIRQMLPVGLQIGALLISDTLPLEVMVALPS